MVPTLWQTVEPMRRKGDIFWKKGELSRQNGELFGLCQPVLLWSGPSPACKRGGLRGELPPKIRKSFALSKMSKPIEFKELPGWKFQADEISAGIYRGAGCDAEGRSIESIGTDPDAVIEKCRQSAVEISRANHPSPEPTHRQTPTPWARR
jgi:hypothetical protein